MNEYSNKVRPCEKSANLNARKYRSNYFINQKTIFRGNPNHILVKRIVFFFFFATLEIVKNKANNEMFFLTCIIL